ncbi:MAG TPA: zinc ribbon domain-containing protein [Nitrososphaerales archaeon]|nr:zinc ribbon domain-containing protein [Nitrososphaerales archaeon]
MKRMANRFCSQCGSALQGGSPYCPNCGFAASPQAPPGSSPVYFTRESRAERRAERRQGPRTGFGGLVVATIFVMVGLGIFFPDLPWYTFWGSLWLLLGVWIAFASARRGRNYSKEAQSVPVRG